ncbi:MAG: ABC transporter ATP-binding protein [Clostridia bacterium]
MLTLSNISKSFGDITAVNGISFELNKGEVLGLLGPNGAGKSTTISMIATLIKPDSGSIKYLDTAISKTNNKIKQDLGYVPQDIALYPTLTGLDNLKFWGSAYGVKKDLLNKRINDISEIIGIESRLKDKVETYSGGMKRRLNIGCALLHKPKLLILDEPTVGIDPQSRRHILDSVKYLNENGTTVLYTSHYMEEVEYLCDRICIMDQGNIIAKGTKKELIDLSKIEKQIIIEVSKNPKEVSLSIAKLPYVSSSDWGENVIRINLLSNNNSYIDIMHIIADSDSKLLKMDIKEVDLEAVFLALTGKQLRD